MMKTTQTAVIATIILTLLILPACSGYRRPEASKTTIDKCQGALHEIPELAALGRTRNKDNGEGQDRALEGMQIALTINGMIRSHSDPEDEIDSWCDAENTRPNFDKILEALKQNSIPPTVDFVIGRNIDEALLKEWLKKGNLVGNMTYSRVKARRKSADEFTNDVARSDEVLGVFWKEFPPKRKYFRYPRLKIGRTSEMREVIKAYLKQANYMEVPATIQGKDHEFNEVYCAAQARGDQDCVNLIKAQFKSLLLGVTSKARAVARSRAGYDVKHILTIHASQFTADILGDTLAYYKSLGVRFISLEEALADPIYSLVDEKGKPAARAIMRETRRAQLAGDTIE